MTSVESYEKNVVHHPMKQAARPLRVCSILLIIVVAVSVGTGSFPVSASANAEPQSVGTSSSTECVCGPKRMDVLLFDFEDAKHNASYSPLTYTRIVAQMNASFYMQSYGKMWIVGGQIYGWYSSGLHLSDFKRTRGLVFYAPDDQGLKLEDVALSKAQSLGLTGYVMAVFAGPIWSWAHYDKTVSVQAESDGLEYFMHEFGHLIGLPDLRYERMQGWDLMDSNTTELSAWSRIQLGWLTGDAIASVDAAKPVLLSVNLIDFPEGTRAVKIPAAQLLGYYLIETRLTAGYGMSLLVYSVEDSSREGGTPGAFKTVLTSDPDWNRLLIRNEFAIIILDKQSDGLRIDVTTREIGEKARMAVEALQSASASIQSAQSSKRTQGLSDAQIELDKAWEAYRVADFQTASSLAEKAKSLAEASTIPQPVNEFSNSALALMVTVASLVLVSGVFFLRRRSRVTRGRAKQPRMIVEFKGSTYSNLPLARFESP